MSAKQLRRLSRSVNDVAAIVHSMETGSLTPMWKRARRRNFDVVVVKFLVGLLRSK